MASNDTSSSKMLVALLLGGAALWWFTQKDKPAGHDIQDVVDPESERWQHVSERMRERILDLEQRGKLQVDGVLIEDSDDIFEARGSRELVDAMLDNSIRVKVHKSHLQKRRGEPQEYPGLPDRDPNLVPADFHNGITLLVSRRDLRPAPRAHRKAHPRKG